MSSKQKDKPIQVLRNPYPKENPSMHIVHVEYRTVYTNKQCKQPSYQKKMQVANHDRPIHLNHQQCHPGDCQHYGRAKCAGPRRSTFPNVLVALPQQRRCYPPHARLRGRLDPHCARASPFDRIRRARSPTWPRTSPAGQELQLKPMSHMA